MEFANDISSRFVVAAYNDTIKEECVGDSYSLSKELRVGNIIDCFFWCLFRKQLFDFFARSDGDGTFLYIDEAFWRML